MAMTKEGRIALVGAGAIALVYFGVLDPVLKFLGLKDKKETIELDKAAEDPGSPWNPNFWRKNTPAMILTRAGAEARAKQIYEAFGLFDDYEEQAIAVFKALKYQTQLSFLADVFAQLYNQDMLTFLRGGNWPKDRLSDADVQDINAFILKLPIK
jgi:hypothetical protein